MAKLRVVYFWMLTVVAILGYVLFANVFHRTDGLLMYGSFALLFLIGLVLTHMAVKNGIHWVQVFVAGLLFRGVFLVATPHFSDDYFRFTWDGQLQQDGISSFAFLPQDYTRFFAGDSLQLGKYKALYEARSEVFPDGMNSKNYYSIYPTLSQMVFRVSGMLGSPNHRNLVVMRVFLILAEVASFFLLLALLRPLQVHPGLAGLFWLNPLVVIEVTGNLHFDGIALCFVLLTLYALSRAAYTGAGFALALAVCTKLNPLFLAGAAFRKIPLRSFLWFGSVTIAGSLVLLLISLDMHGFCNFKKSFGLYFAWFEFNAGPYYFVREVGRLLFGIDLSPIISNVFPVLTVLLFARVFWNPNTGLSDRFLLLYFIYFSFSPIVHPWYLVVMVPLAVLSRKLYPLLWSLLVFCSYTHYREPFGENLVVIFLEYAIVYALFFVESRRGIAVLEHIKMDYWGAGVTQSRS